MTLVSNTVSHRPFDTQFKKLSMRPVSCHIVLPLVHFHCANNICFPSFTMYCNKGVDVFLVFVKGSNHSYSVLCGRCHMHGQASGFYPQRWVDSMIVGNLAQSPHTQAHSKSPHSHKIEKENQAQDPRLKAHSENHSLMAPLISRQPPCFLPLQDAALPYIGMRTPNISCHMASLWL